MRRSRGPVARRMRLARACIRERTLHEPVASADGWARPEGGDGQLPVDHRCSPQGLTVRGAVVGMLRRHGEVETVRLVEATGASRQYLALLVQRGVIRRSRHGAYILVDNDNRSQ